MKLLPVHPIFWSSLLVLWASQSEMEANNPDVCQQEKPLDELVTQSSSVPGHDVKVTALDGNFLCVLYPTNELNCSWSFHTIQKDAQIAVYISICDDESAVHSPLHSSGERVGSRSLTLCEYEDLHVILHFNITLHDKWTVYAYAYNEDMLEVLPPPQNLSAAVKDGGVLVTWALPHSRKQLPIQCLEFQLDMGDQEGLQNVTGKLCYTKLQADPGCTYRVKIRMRKSAVCLSPLQWSDWSHTVTVEPAYKLNTMVIILISLGVPMTLLAVLLLVRHQRVSKVLFPPIPRPPPKYKCFLEKNDTVNFFNPAPSAEPEAEITEVEDAEQNPGKTF